MAKKQVCSTVLVRPGSPASRATASASTAYSRSRLSMICCCTGPGRASHTSSRRLRGVEQQRRAVLGAGEHVDRVEQAEVVAADEARAWLTR